MDKLTQQQLREIYAKLPEDLKDAIFSVNSADVIMSIGKKYNLTINKMGELADETGLVMLGLTPPNNFISNLNGRLEVDAEVAKKIAEEINSEIFSKIRESLKKIHGTTEAGWVAESEIHQGKEEILKEIEKNDEAINNAPEIIKGTTQPPLNPFEAKTKEIVRMPLVEKKYTSQDPYREPIE